MRQSLLGLALLGLALSLTACGGGEIQENEVRLGDVRSGTPTALRDGGEPVTGLVVRKGAGDKVLAETEYKDGFPEGVMREWYDGGQQKSERNVRLGTTPRGQDLVDVGTRRSWCENGTLREERDYDADGNPQGTHKMWTCAGKPLMLETFPRGEFKTWIERENGETVLTQEGYRVDSRQLEGEFKSYHSGGTPMQRSNWKNEKLDGEFERWNAEGVLQESGRYVEGNKVGLWTVAYLGDAWQLWDFDEANFINPEYAPAFMQAAGIDAQGHAGIADFQVDAEKIRYYVTQGHVDPKKKVNLDLNTPRQQFESHKWTYPYVAASKAAVPILLELGVDPKVTDSSRRQRLHYCIDSLYSTCSVAELKELIALGQDAKLADSMGNTPLHGLLRTWYSVPDTANRGVRRPATLADLEPAMSLLLEAGADPDAQNHEGRTPAMIALQGRLYDVAGALLQRSKNPKIATKGGYNLLHMAFMDSAFMRFELELTDERKAFAELAVAKGLDPKQKIGNGDSLVQIAEKAGAIDLAQYLAGLGS